MWLWYSTSILAFNAKCTNQPTPVIAILVKNMGIINDYFSSTKCTHAVVCFRLYFFFSFSKCDHDYNKIIYKNPDVKHTYPHLLTRSCNFKESPWQHFPYDIYPKTKNSHAIINLNLKNCPSFNRFLSWYSFLLNSTCHQIKYIQYIHSSITTHLIYNFLISTIK